ncbi:MAG: hypothetical protein GTO41_15305 [Burkholderiales bacterium]|nr:hypothetical protein [Burkholderiales bacterium]
MTCFTVTLALILYCAARAMRGLFEKNDTELMQFKAAERNRFDSQRATSERQRFQRLASPY